MQIHFFLNLSIIPNTGNVWQYFAGETNCSLPRGKVTDFIKWFYNLMQRLQPQCNLMQKKKKKQFKRTQIEVILKWLSSLKAVNWSTGEHTQGWHLLLTELWSSTHWLLNANEKLSHVWCKPGQEEKAG